MSDLSNTSDAMVWAEEFSRTLTEHPEIDPKDPGFMVGWFANAMAAQERAAAVSIPTEPGTVNFRVEIVPHLWHTDGTGYCSGTLTPAEVGDRLREYASQAESFTAAAPVLSGRPEADQ